MDAASRSVCVARITHGHHSHSSIILHGVILTRRRLLLDLLLLMLLLLLLRFTVEHDTAPDLSLRLMLVLLRG